MTDRRIIRGLEEAVRHSRGEIEATTHRVTVLDYPARHIVIGPRAIASHRAWQSLGTGAKRVVSALSGAIAIASRFISYNAPALVLGFIAGVLAVIVPAYIVSFFL